MNFYKIIKKTYVYLLAFLLPTAIMLAVYIFMGIYPFGPKTLLTIDMTNEYIDYFSAFKSIMTGGGSIFYSFGKLLGGNMTGLFAYYLASPFNVVFLFFSKDNFDIAILLLTLLKIGSSGVTFAVYIDRTFKKPGLLTAVFSVFYALMAYNIVYQLNIMWLDGVICLPIVVLGIDRIVDHKKPLLYYIFLTLAILTNYYIGFMICIFSLLYFIYRMLIGENFNASFMKAKFFMRELGSFIFTSLLAAGTSCFLLLPALLSLQTGKEQFLPARLGLYPDYHFWSIFSKLVLGSFTFQDVVNGLPEIFCGLLITLLLCLYFFNHLITLREKLYSGAFILIILLNFYLNTFNIIWHGVNHPTWFPFRYSFVFSFLLIVLAYKSAINLRGVRLRHIILTCVIMLISLIMLARGNYADLSVKKIAISAAFTAVYSAILIYSARTRRFSSKLLALMLLPYVFCEFAYNSFEVLTNFTYASKAYYSSFVQQTGGVIDAINAQDKGFFRLEKNFTRLNYDSDGNPTFNDSLMFGYNGLSHYSSTDDKRVNRLMQDLGFKSNYNWAYYERGSTAAANSLLGVKYILSQTTMDSGYNLQSYSNGIYVYKNPNALPVGYMADSSIEKIAPNNKNPFILQNSILRSVLSNKQAECFYVMGISNTEFDNVRAVKNGTTTRFVRENQNKEASVQFSLRVAGSGQVYAFFNSEQLHQVSLTLNGQPFGTYFDSYNDGVLPLGNYQNGSEITLKMTLKGVETNISDEEFYLLNMGLLNRDCDSIKKGGLEVSSYGSTYISGSVTSSGTGKVLLTTIPYDSGWTVSVDGRKTAKIKVLNSLIGVNVPPGRHKVELRYKPEGFTAGCVISIACVLISALYFYALYNRGRE